MKYRVPGLTPETVQSTSWFLSMDEAEIDFNSLDARKLTENIPAIELKPQLPSDSFKAPPDQPNINGRYRSRGKIPSK